MKQPPPMASRERASEEQEASQKLGGNAGMRMILPIERSFWAIAAGYFGLFSFLVFPAPISLLVSLLAIQDIRKSQGTENVKYGMGRAVFGLIMGVLGTILLLSLFVSPFLTGGTGSP